MMIKSSPLRHNDTNSKYYRRRCSSERQPRLTQRNDAARTALQAEVVEQIGRLIGDAEAARTFTYRDGHPGRRVSASDAGGEGGGDEETGPVAGASGGGEQQQKKTPRQQEPPPAASCFPPPGTALSWALEELGVAGFDQGAECGRLGFESLAAPVLCCWELPVESNPPGGPPPGRPR